MVLVRRVYRVYGVCRVESVRVDGVMEFWSFGISKVQLV